MDLAKELFNHISSHHDKLSVLSKEVLLGLLDEPGELDDELILLELFRRGALYEVIAKYPGDKTYIIDVYNMYCLVNRIVKKEVR